MNMKVHRWKTITTALAAAASLALAIGAAPSRAATAAESAKVNAGLSANSLSELPLTNRHLTNREKENLAVVLGAYHDGEGDSLDPQGFRDLLAADGVLNGIGGVKGQTSLRGSQRTRPRASHEGDRRQVHGGRDLVKPRSFSTARPILCSPLRGRSTYSAIWATCPSPWESLTSRPRPLAMTWRRYAMDGSPCCTRY
jgi:hypothetical protein